MIAESRKGKLNVFFGPSIDLFFMAMEIAYSKRFVFSFPWMIAESRKGKLNVFFGPSIDLFFMAMEIAYSNAHFSSRE